MKKFVSIALSALTLVTLSVGASAAALTPEVTLGANEKITVADDAQNASDAVILAIRQNGSGKALNLETEAVQNTIVYVDQASAANGFEFNFLPKTDVAGNTVTVFVAGAGADAIYSEDIAMNAITYNLNGGSEGAGWVKNYVSADGYTLPQDATKAGYTFAGWYDNAEFTGDAVTAIEAGSKGPKTFYANWTANLDAVAADAGYCTNNNGEKVGVISVTATFKAEGAAHRAGFLVYREGKTPKNIYAEGITDIKDGVFTVVYNIPEEYFGTDVIFKPYLMETAGSAPVYGAVANYSVNSASASAELKNLGSLDAFIAEMNK